MFNPPKQKTFLVTTQFCCTFAATAAAIRIQHSRAGVPDLALRKNRKELNPAAAAAEDIVAGGLLDLAPLADASAADISAALAAKGLRVEQVPLRDVWPSRTSSRGGPHPPSQMSSTA